jgi:hypothetical protein
MSKRGPTPMSPAAAVRIQSHADRTGRNRGFKSRAQSAAFGAPGGPPISPGPGGQPGGHGSGK